MFKDFTIGLKQDLGRGQEFQYSRLTRSKYLYYTSLYTNPTGCRGNYSNNKKEEGNYNLDQNYCNLYSYYCQDNKGTQGSQLEHSTPA